MGTSQLTDLPFHFELRLSRRARPKPQSTRAEQAVLADLRQHGLTAEVRSAQISTARATAPLIVILSVDCILDWSYLSWSVVDVCARRAATRDVWVFLRRDGRIVHSQTFLISKGKEAQALGYGPGDDMVRTLPFPLLDERLTGVFLRLVHGATVVSRAAELSQPGVAFQGEMATDVQKAETDAGAAWDELRTIVAEHENDETVASVAESGRRVLSAVKLEVEAAASGTLFGKTFATGILRGETGGPEDDAHQLLAMTVAFAVEWDVNPDNVPQRVHDSMARGMQPS